MECSYQTAANQTIMTKIDVQKMPQLYLTFGAFFIVLFI